MDDLFSSQAIQRAKFQGRLNVEKPSLSDADFSSEARKNVDSTPPASSGSHQKQQAETKVSQNDEVVKYMSNLPSYLEKGKNLKEKALSVGVLDWRRLEKWQYNHKQKSCQSSKCSPSSSNTSSSSTDGPSTHSSTDRSCSPGIQRMLQPTLQSYLNSSRKEGCSVGVETTVENVGNFEDLKAASSNSLKVQQSTFGMYHSSIKIQSEINPSECKRKDTELPNIPEIERSLDLKNCGAVSKSKGKTKIQDSKPTSELDELQEPHCDVNSNFHERHRITLQPQDVPESSRSVVACPYVLAAVNGRRSTEASRRSISEGSYPKAVHNAGSYSAILRPRPRPLPCEDDNTQRLQMKQPSSVDAKNNKSSNESSQSPPCSVKMSTNPSRGKNLAEKSSKEMTANSTVTESSGGSNLEKDRVEASKLRNPSPTRRFSIGLGRMGRTLGSRDSSPVPQSSAECVTAKSGSQKIMASSCFENSGNEKPNSTKRSQSSPLRRLLDPLLRPKAVNSHHSAEPSEKDPTSTVRARKSSNGRVESSAAHFVKLKLDLRSCKTINVDDPHHSEKQRSSTVQALLQLTVKNGLPLFTFTDDNNSDILAATIRKLNASRKADNIWIYTFFNFHEVKKKSGWINQGSKGKSHGYLPKVVAQMRVSDSQFPSLVRHNSVDEVSIKEFVLFAVDLREADRHISSDFQPNDELAAIVVKYPKETPRSLNKDGQQRDDEENESSVRSRGCLSTTVILPGGIHGLPSKGEPSSLIERWKSGGLCDCGGWDLGCRIRVLASQTKNSRRPRSSKAHQVADQYELFPQGEVLDDGPAFSLVPFKDGIFSVEFNSSISFLQAFSICIAVLNTQKPCQISELSKVFEEKTFEETALKGGGIKSPHRIQPEVPASYLPLLPVGRGV